MNLLLVSPGGAWGREQALAPLCINLDILFLKVFLVLRRRGDHRLILLLGICRIDTG